MANLQESNPLRATVAQHDGAIIGVITKVDAWDFTVRWVGLSRTPFYGSYCNNCGYAIEGIETRRVRRFNRRQVHVCSKCGIFKGFRADRQKAERTTDH